MWNLHGRIKRSFTGMTAKGVLRWIRSLLGLVMARIATPFPIPLRITAYPTSFNQSSGSGIHIGATGILPLLQGTRSSKQKAPLHPTRFQASDPLSAIGIKSSRHNSLTGLVTGGMYGHRTAPFSNDPDLPHGNYGNPIFPRMQPGLCDSPANTSTLRIP